MEEILTWIIVIVFAIMGGGSTIVLTVSIPFIIIWKFYRRIKYKISIFD